MTVKGVNYINNLVNAKYHFYPARVRSRGKVIMLGRGIYVNLKRPLQADSPHHYPMEGSSCSLQATPPAH